MRYEDVFCLEDQPVQFQYEYHWHYRYWKAVVKCLGNAEGQSGGKGKRR